MNIKKPPTKFKHNYLTSLGKGWVDAAAKDMIERQRQKEQKEQKDQQDKKTNKCVSGLEGPIVYDVKGTGVLLAKNYEDDIDIEGWWASEKWDGYRAIWNGKNFCSRSGGSFDVPDWYCSVMPPGIALDGELWLGRGKFEECGLLRRKKPVKPVLLTKWENDWKKLDVKYNVFDIMNMNSGFEDRMKELEKLCKVRTNCMKKLGVLGGKSILEFTKQTKVSKSEAIEMAKEVIKGKGEGIMLREPGSLYDPKRSKTLYKIKEVDDMEVVIDGYKNGKGKYINILGSFTCSLVGKPDIKCNVSGMNDEIRNSYLKTHPIGTVITITYNGLTKFGKPRHPRYLRIRHKEGH